MNREIKFRAWDDGVMVYSHTNTFNDFNFQNHFFFERIREDAIVMQYTGLKDKGGKDIYEGDIAVIKNGDPFAPVIKVSVKYEIGSFGVIPINGEVDVFANNYSGKMLPFFPEYKPEVLEVIGNIHSNPELLK